MLKSYFWDIIYPYFKEQVYPRFLEIVTAPGDNLQMLWLIAPVVITMLFVQVYFGRHKEEELGWNTAYGNSIVLIFVSISLFHYLYRTYTYEAMLAFTGTPFYKSLLVLGILLYAFLLFFIDFTHSLHKKIAFFLSSSITIGVAAFVAIVLVYSDVSFDIVTLVTALCILLVVVIFFKLFRWLIPPTEQAVRILKQREERKEELQQERRIERYRKVKHIEHIIKKEVGTLAEKAGKTLNPLRKFLKK